MSERVRNFHGGGAMRRYYLHSLFQHGIKPVLKDALYDLSALDAIKNTTMGRPKKPPVETKASKGKK
jgi:hypothetical protein